MSAATLAQTIGGLADGLHRLTLAGGVRVVVKRRRLAPPDFFAAEARGLAALAAARGLRVPLVHAVDEGAIVIEDLGHGRATPPDWARGGVALARLHGRTHERFGFDANGWCGDSAQDNRYDNDGWRFFAERRLRPQADRAVANALLSSADRARIETLCDRLPTLLPDGPAALVHGDLWIGNLHVCGDGALALIDGAAVHYGWAEGDLAMLTLFGEPSPRFFEAYEAASGVSTQWRERAPLHNLYHLLNHLNLFGASYLGGVRAVLDRFV